MLRERSSPLSPVRVYRSARGWLRYARSSPLLLSTVVLPTLLATLYFGFIASDQYVSESSFMVRSSQRPIQSGLLGTLLQGTSLARALDDTHAVHDYILSRDAVQELNEKLRIAAAFGRPDIDFLSRFAALSWDNNFEALHRYYHRRVSVDVDTNSSIAILRVSAFTAADARSINEAILGMSERFVNDLSDRARQDIVRFAASEVRDAEQKAQDAAIALAEFRTRESVIDPEKQSAVQLQQVLKIEEERIATRTQIEVLERSSPQNPQIPILRARQAVLQKEVNEELEKVTGSQASLTSKSAGYTRVALQREFAEKQLAAAMTFLENARDEAQRQQLYLERIVRPNLPDYAMQPRRVRSILVVFVLGLVTWGILSLLTASVREHYA